MSASIWNPNADNIPIADADSTILIQDFTATASQTLFTLTNFAYTTGTNSLQVFSAGVKLRLTEDYTETSTTSFTLTSGATLGTEITAVGFVGITSEVGITWRGAYAAGTAYVAYDAVSYNGSSYICILASTGNVPTNATYWSVLAAAGAGIGDLISTNNLSDVTSAATARANLVAAKSGSNSDITELTGLTTDLSVAQGGTGSSTAAAARTALSAAELGANNDITSLGALTEQTSHRNLFVNGDMSVAQEFVSTGAAITTSAATYQVDQWSVWASASVAGATMSAARTGGAAMIALGSQYALRVHISAGTYASGSIFATQTLDMSKATRLGGKLCTISFKARIGSVANYTGGTTPTLSTYSGTGSTEQSQVTGVAGSWTGHAAVSWTADAANQSLSTSFQTYVFTGTLAASITQLLCSITVGGAGAGHADNWIEIMELQLEPGGVATPFEHLPPQVNLAQCQRYLCTSYPVGVAPSSASTDGRISLLTPAGGTSSMYCTVFFPVAMRAIPSVTAYDTLGASGKVFKGATGKTASITYIGNTSALIGTVDATSTNQLDFLYMAKAQF